MMRVVGTPTTQCDGEISNRPSLGSWHGGGNRTTGINSLHTRCLPHKCLPHRFRTLLVISLEGSSFNCRFPKVEPTIR